MNDQAPPEPAPESAPEPAPDPGSSGADALAGLVADALIQAEELPELDAVRAELWASDLVALAAELADDGPGVVVDQLAAVGGPGPAAALWAIDAVSDLVDLSDPALEPAPSWADQLLTSTCEAAWVIGDWRGDSAAFRFVDAADERHVVVLDLVPGPDGDMIGEATVGPAELLDAIADDSVALRSDPVAAPELAARVVAAVRATTEPSSSFVAVARVVLARLSTFGVAGADDLEPPVWVEPDVPELPPRDPDDDAWASDVVRRALGDPVALDPGASDVPPSIAVATAVAQAAAVLRDAAEHDDPLAQWLAASVGPVDLDESDADVVLAALAAAVAPADLAPLSVEARRAVLELEFADWLGAVLGLVRAGAGTRVDPDVLVDLVNRCPEVTSTIPKADRARVAWAFAVAAESWAPLGLVDDEDRLTEFGTAVLPSVLLRAWQPA
ncbi:MAG: hypothetical protein AAGE98_04545 [Actinomycetota bacterium]